MVIWNIYLYFYCTEKNLATLLANGVGRVGSLSQCCLFTYVHRYVVGVACFLQMSVPHKSSPKTLVLNSIQGDQIGRNFRPFRDCLLWAAFLKLQK
jgi:hypothetical protein